MERQAQKIYDYAISYVESLGDEITNLESQYEDLQNKYDELEEKYNSLLETISNDDKSN